MECERPSAEYDQAFVRMSVGSGRKVASSSQPMPKIGLCSSTRSLNRSIQHLVQEDVENRPEHRPPTPARPSLPTLLPGRLLDVSLSASVGSTKSEGRVPSQPRRAAFAAFPRSSSEPRSLAASPRPQQDADEDAGEDAPGDLLDASTRSEGWDHLRGSRGRGPAAPSEGHVVPLPPINRPRYSEAGGKGRSSVRGRGAAAAGGAAAEENVLSVAKKTLEQLETVLAPKEATAALPRTIPRTRTGHQIHLET